MALSVILNEVKNLAFHRRASDISWTGTQREILRSAQNDNFGVPVCDWVHRKIRSWA
jgi:hypothetical protein